MRSRFDEQLALLSQSLVDMGALCERVIALAGEALVSGDHAQAAQVKPLEREIDQMEREIETLCLKLLLHQQPVARDLRQISAALKMITDMERVGDQAADIAEIIRFLGNRSGEECEPIAAMARETIRMVTSSVEAYVKQDLDGAHAVIAHDDEVDRLFCAVRKRLVELIAANPDDGEYAVDLLMIAKYFERIGDHAVNIAEWAVFSVTGVHNGQTEM